MKSVSGIIIAMLCYTHAWSNPAIDTSYAVKIGGINQWINIKGKDISTPLLLWLHGGPGGSDMGYASKFTNKLNSHYIVVEWDQRESGKTAILNHSPDITLAQIHQDVFELITYLLHQFHKKKLVLVGNSWGGFLALHAANQYPELLEACILVSPSIYFHESEEVSLQYVKDEANKRKNNIAIQQIDSIRFPFEKPMDLWLLRKWMYTFHYNTPRI